MQFLTHNNHFKFGYNNEWFRFRQSPDDAWTVSYGCCERPVGDFRAECHATARLIRDSIQEPLALLFSGGADSEVVLRSFVEQKIPIDVVICQFADKLNAFDVDVAITCCEQLGIPYKLVALDILEFLNSGRYLEYADATQIRSPELCSTMWLADQIDNVPIMGSGECYVVKRVPMSYIDGVSPYDPTPWDMYEKELIAGWYRHFMRPGHERLAVPGFFQYTPEIMLSFLQDQRVVDLVHDRVIGKRSTLTSKLGIYQKYFPLANREKYTGYERLSARVTDIRLILRQRYPKANGIFLTEYPDLVAMLEGRITGPKGMHILDAYKFETTDAVPQTPSSPWIDETRQLTIDDFEQVIELLEERFGTMIEFDRAERRNLITRDEAHEDFRQKLLAKWRNVIADYYLQGRTHKMFGSFSHGKLMSMVGMRLVFENGWVLSNLRAKKLSLSQTGLRFTLAMLYQHAKDIGRTEYYCSIAEYRHNKFAIMMRHLVPQYYSEYEEEVLEIIPPGKKASNDFYWGLMGRMPCEVPVMIKRMKLHA